MPLHIDVEAGDMAQGIPPLRRVEHHGEGLAPAAQAQPVEIVHRLTALHAFAQQFKALMGIPQSGVDDQAPWCAGEPLHQLRCFVDAAVPPDPGGHRCRQQRFEDRQALAQGAMAAPQNHNIAAGGGTAPFLRQWAVGGHECFEGLPRIDGWRQGDQASRHQRAQGWIDVLPTQVFRTGLSLKISHRLHHGPIQGRRAEGKVGIQHRLASRSNQGGGLLSGDRPRQATTADQLLLGPGGLPDQQAEGVGPCARAALLLGGPELFEVVGHLRRCQFQRGLQGELRGHGDG